MKIALRQDWDSNQLRWRLQSDGDSAEKLEIYYQVSMMPRGFLGNQEARYYSYGIYTPVKLSLYHN